jgi:hypothetical protein
MSVVIRFRPSGLTRQQYDTVHSVLEHAGEWPADGLQVHVCFGDEGDLRVSEIWESREQLDAFGEKLRPHLAAAGVEITEDPEVFDVVNLERF